MAHKTGLAHPKIALQIDLPGRWKLMEGAIQGPGESLREQGTIGLRKQEPLTDHEGIHLRHVGRLRDLGLGGLDARQGF